MNCKFLDEFPQFLLQSEYNLRNANLVQFVFLKCTLPGRSIGCTPPPSGATLEIFPDVIWTVPNFTLAASIV